MRPARTEFVGRVDSLLDTEVAWAAGIIDGEGCIMVICNGRRGGEYSLQVKIGCTEPEMLLRMQEYFGGAIHSRTIDPHREYAKRHRKPVWAWTIYSSRAALALERMLPFLVVKRSQAAVALQFAATHVFDGGRISPEARALRAQYKEQLHVLKREVG